MAWRFHFPIRKYDFNMNVEVRVSHAYMTTLIFWGGSQASDNLLSSWGSPDIAINIQYMQLCYLQNNVE